MIDYTSADETGYAVVWPIAITRVINKHALVDWIPSILAYFRFMIEELVC